MSTQNDGGQELFFKYKFPLNAGILTNRFQGIADLGIYEGLDLTVESTVSTRIAVGAVEIGDGSYQTKIRFGVEFVISTSDTSKPYIIVRWNFVESETDIYAEILSKAYADILSTDVVLGKVLFNASDEVAGFDYSLATYPMRKYTEDYQIAGRVLSTQPETSSVHVNTARVKTNNGFLSIAAGDYPTAGAPSVNPRYDLVYLGGAGTIQFESGAEAVSPEIPGFKNRLVLAYIYRYVGQNTIYDEDINWVNYNEQSIEGDFFVRGDEDISGSETVNSGQSGGVFTAKGNTDANLIKTLPATDQVGIGSATVTAGYKAETGGNHKTNGKHSTTTLRFQDQSETEMSYTADPVNESFGTPTKGVRFAGFVSAYRTVNPRYMDIAESFPSEKGYPEKFPPGSLVYFDERGIAGSRGIFYTGVYSNTYGHLLGALPKDGTRVPVALKGSVLVNIPRRYFKKIRSGDLIVPGKATYKHLGVPVKEKKYLKSLDKVGKVISADEEFIYTIFPKKMVGNLQSVNYFRVLVWLD